VVIVVDFTSPLSSFSSICLSSTGALAVGGVLMGTGLSIGYMSLQHVLSFATTEVEAVSSAMWSAALGVTAVSVISKELLFHYTM
jgi:divalent metal cation (Fe/Co/Zn/Cd) transporter